MKHCHTNYYSREKQISSFLFEQFEKECGIVHCALWVSFLTNLGWKELWHILQKKNPRFARIVAKPAFWYWGGGKLPKCTDRRKEKMYIKVICASERLRNIQVYIFRSPNTSTYIWIYTIYAVLFYYLW